MAPCFKKGRCQRPQINIKLFEKHLQIYRKSNWMCFMTETNWSVSEILGDWAIPALTCCLETESNAFACWLSSSNCQNFHALFPPDRARNGQQFWYQFESTWRRVIKELPGSHWPFHLPSLMRLSHFDYSVLYLSFTLKNLMLTSIFIDLYLQFIFVYYQR